ncbi:hypothetical protein ZWY2020_018184 [Hordeum vulgare]|nr:hypothetical protein ZWY2020_018184 [Hordeum vulgare]
MNSNDWRPTQGSNPRAGVDPPPTGGPGDWRAQLLPDERSRNVDWILETLQRHLPVSHPDGLNELQKIAVRIEQRICDAATNQSDYCWDISLKILSMMMPTQQALGNTKVIPNQYNLAPALSTQGSNQAHTSAIPLMSRQQAWQPNTSTFVQASSLTSIGQNLAGVNQISTAHNMSVMPHRTINNGLAQGTSQDIYPAQRQMAGRQQQQESQQFTYHQHQQPFPQSQQPNIYLQQHKQQLMGQKPNLQQNQVIGQWDYAAEMHQQQRLPVQSYNFVNVQQTKQMLNHQYMPLHQSQQRGSQANMSSLQQHQQNQKHQQLLGTAPNVLNMQWMHMPQIKAQQPQEQQHAQQQPMGLMQPQSQQSPQHLMSQCVAQPNQLQEHLGMQPQSSVQQKFQTSGGMLLQQNNMDQIQAQMGLQEISSSTSADSTAQTGREGADDYWQEEIYQMVKVLKDQYFAEIGELYNKISLKLQDVENIIPPQMPSEKYDRIKSFKIILNRILQMLQISKSAIQPSMRDRVPQYEKQIIAILNSQRKTLHPQIQQ